MSIIVKARYYPGDRVTVSYPAVVVETRFTEAGVIYCVEDERTGEESVFKDTYLIEGIA